jgi:hypothetical protein
VPSAECFKDKGRLAPRIEKISAFLDALANMKNLFAFATISFKKKARSLRR